MDVVAVDLRRHTVRIIAEGKTRQNAETIEMMAVARRGVESEFFATVEDGAYKDGDKWNGGAIN